MNRSKYNSTHVNLKMYTHTHTLLLGIYYIHIAECEQSSQLSEHGEINQTTKAKQHCSSNFTVYSELCIRPLI